MSKRVTFTRKELSKYIEDNLERGATKTAEFQQVHGLYGAAAFEAGYYEQVLISLKKMMDSRYEV